MEGNSQSQASSQITPRLEVKIENLEHQVSDIKIKMRNQMKKKFGIQE